MPNTTNTATKDNIAKSLSDILLASDYNLNERFELFLAQENLPKLSFSHPKHGVMAYCIKGQSVAKTGDIANANLKQNVLKAIELAGSGINLLDIPAYKSIRQLAPTHSAIIRLDEKYIELVLRRIDDVGVSTSVICATKDDNNNKHLKTIDDSVFDGVDWAIVTENNQEELASTVYDLFNFLNDVHSTIENNVSPY